MTRVLKRPALPDTREGLARLSIERWEHLLEQETDPEGRVKLEGLLADARSELDAFQKSRRSGRKTRTIVKPPEAARRLKLRAEEYRTLADSCDNPGSRATFLQLSRTYAGLADRAERRR
jgi:hypothetical protein